MGEMTPHIEAAIGLHLAMDERTYHADPCCSAGQLNFAEGGGPSLNHSVARAMLRSPLHAWRAHPRLGGAAQRSPSREMALGSAAHALTLGKGAALARIDADNYLTKDAKNARDAAYAQGFIPLLAREYALAEAMAAEAGPLIRAELGEGFHAEAVAIARDELGSWLRCMIDAMTPDRRVLLDYKTTDSAEPEAFARKVREEYSTQAAFYSHILDLIDPEGAGRRRFVFCAQERDCPQAITFYELDPALMEIAAKQMERARVKWAACLKLGKWPAYERGPHIVAPKPWDLDAEMERQFQDDSAQAALEAEKYF